MRMKKEQKEKLIIMSCIRKIQLSPNENQESQIQKNVLKYDEILQSFFLQVFALQFR